MRKKLTRSTLDKTLENTGMTTEIFVPELGDTSEIDVIEVLVAVGDVIAIDDPLITLETDKASMDIPATKAGTVKELKVSEGDKVTSGSLILLMDVDEGSATEDAPDKASPPAEAKDSEPEPDSNSEPEPEPEPESKPGATHLVKVEAATVNHDAFIRVHASPSVRRIARELGVDLAGLNATGAYGRITQQDLRDHQERGSTAASGMGIPVIKQPDWSQFGSVSEQSMSRINRLAAKHLHGAWLNVPHVTQFDEADITELEAYRQKTKARAVAEGYSFTPLVFMMKAAVSALKAFPRFNSALSDNGEILIQRDYYNLGIAVDTPNGLVVPVVRNVDSKGLLELAKELSELSARARKGKLTSADMQGGCFTISSLGGVAGTNFTPIVNAPEVGILGVTPAKERLERVNGEIVDRLIQPLAVSYDHRVIDGVYAARFTNHIAFILSDLRNLSL
jgi:pyruvate dehydrogenase E2 component (dihydrolipoamide acetyltransferase)